MLCFKDVNGKKNNETTMGTEECQCKTNPQ